MRERERVERKESRYRSAVARGKKEYAGFCGARSGLRERM